MTPVDLLGWCATAVFVSSYFAKHPTTLRHLQILGASLWMLYGFALQAAPVVVANVLVVLAAAGTARRNRTQRVAS